MSKRALALSVLMFAGLANLNCGGDGPKDGAAGKGGSGSGGRGGSAAGGRGGGGGQDAGTPTDAPTDAAGYAGSTAGSGGAAGGAAGAGGGVAGAGGRGGGTAGGGGGGAAGTAAGGGGAAGTAAGGGGAAGTAAGGGGAAGTAAGGGGAAGTAAGGGGAAGTTAGAGGGGASGTGGAPPTQAAVQAIVNERCINCHTGTGDTLPTVMDLTPITNVVGVASIECPTKLRIAPGSPQTSYLVDKIIGMSQTTGACFMGARMPLGATPLSAAEIAIFQGWIASLPP